MDTIVWNLTKINALLKKLSKDCQTFTDNYDAWVVRRERTISIFHKLRNEVDNIHLCSSTAKAVGSGVGILGGLATIAGFALTFSKDENMRQLGKKLTKNGSVASFMGAASTTTISLFEAGLSEVKLDDAKACLEEDIKYTAKLMPGLRNAIKLDALFQEVFGCSILTDNWLDIHAVLENMMVIVEQTAYTLEDVDEIIITGVKKLYSDVVKEYNKNNSFDLEKISKEIQFLNNKTKLILKAFCNNPEVRKAVEEMCNSFKQSPGILDMCKINLNTRVELKVLDSTKMLILSIIVSNFDSSAAQSILAAAEISKHVITFLSAVKDIRGRKSYYSELLEKTKLVLNEELRIIKNAYNELNK